MSEEANFRKPLTLIQKPDCTNQLHKILAPGPEDTKARGFQPAKSFYVFNRKITFFNRKIFNRNLIKKFNILKLKFFFQCHINIIKF